MNYLYFYILGNKSKTSDTLILIPRIQRRSPYCLELTVILFKSSDIIDILLPTSNYILDRVCDRRDRSSDSITKN